MSYSSAILAFSGLVAAASTLAAEQDAGIPILVSADASVPGQPAQVSENARRLLQYLAAQTQFQLIIQPMPWQRALVSAQAGQGVLYGASKSAEREAVLRFSEPIYSDQVWLVKRCDSPLQFAQLSDLQDKSVGVVRGSAYGEEFDRAANVLFKAELDANNNRSRFAKLLRKRSDALVIYSQVQDTRVLESDLNKKYGALAASESGAMQTHPFCVLPKAVASRSVHFALAPGYNEAFLARLNSALRKARTSGELAKIYSGRLSN